MNRVGPWIFYVRGGNALDLFAPTCIDQVLGYLTGAIITSKSSEKVPAASESCGLSMFSTPEIYTCDNGGELCSSEFDHLLYNWAILHV